MQDIDLNETAEEISKKKPKKKEVRYEDLAKKHDLYQIKMNTHHLFAIEDDMESLYYRNAKSTKDFSFSVKTGEKMSNVKMRLLYFPFEEGRESMPIPQNVLQSNPDLTTRKAGVEVYWNERLIREAHMQLTEAVGFASPGVISGTKIEDKWLMRIKAILFINSDFPVTHNKMHICKEDFAYKNLKATSDRQFEKEFRKWVVHCHVKYDQELLYLGEKHNPSENKTFCEGIKKGSETFKLKDYVRVNLRPKIVAQLEQIYYKGAPDAKLSEGYGVFVPMSYKDSGKKQEHPIARVLMYFHLKK